MSGWRARLTVPAAAVPAVESAIEETFSLADDVPGLACFEMEGSGNWLVEVYFADPPPRDEIARVAETAAAETGARITRPEIERIADRDWVGESQSLRPPVIAGRLFVHGGHARAARRAYGINLQIEAGQAFGTGAHETTRGCLLVLDRLVRRIRPRRPLDLGCGSGVLALAMARLWRRGVMASDIDPKAAEVTAENARINHIPLRARPAAGWGVAPLAAAGLAHRRLREAGPYDLVLANILAGPLVAMAPGIARAVEPGGRLVLAGLLESQEAAVIAAYRNRGFRREDRIGLGRWPTLLLRKANTKAR